MRRLLIGCVGLILAPSLPIGAATSIATPDSDGDVGRFVSLALDGEGRPVISYQDLTNRDLRILRCTTADCAGDQSNGITVADKTGLVGSYTSIALAAGDRPVVAYFDGTDGNLKLMFCDEPDCDGGREFVIPDKEGLPDIVGMYTSLALDAVGHPVASYYDFSNGDLKVLHCSNPSCSADQDHVISIPDQRGDVGLYTSLALDQNGNPVVSYHDATEGTLKLLHCDDPGCTGNEVGNIAVPDGDQTGWSTSLALDAVGNPVVAYVDFNTGRLKLLHCDDPGCRGDESANISTPLAPDAIAGHLSLKLSADGNPILSYYDANGGTLKLLHCDDPACNGDESRNIAVLDSRDDVGWYSSLALGLGGNPIVGYYDVTAGDLKVLRCSNPLCIE